MKLISGNSYIKREKENIFVDQFPLDKILKDEVYTELNESYNHLMQHRLLNQIRTIKKGKPPNNYINPKKLSRIEQTVFRTIFKRIEDIQTKLKLDFTGGA